MTRHIPSAPRARSTVTDGSRSAATKGRDGRQVEIGRRAVVRYVGMRADQPADAVHPPGTYLGGPELLAPAQHEPAGEVVVAQLSESTGHPPGGGGIGEIRGVGRLVPVVLHRLGVVAENRRAAAELPARLVEAVPVGIGGPHRWWRDPGQRRVPARQLMRLAVLLRWCAARPAARPAPR